MMLRRTRFDAPLILFFLSAIWGVWIAYDSAAAARCLAFLCAGLALYYLLALLPSRVAWRGTGIPLLRIFLGLTPALISAYFILTNDWTQPVEKLGWLDPVRERLGALQPRLVWPRLHPNVAAACWPCCCRCRWQPCCREGEPETPAHLPVSSSSTLSCW